MNLSGKRPEIDEIDTKLTIKPSADESCYDDHSDHFCFGTQSFDRSPSSDVEEVIEQSQKP
ncbi:hypothetical protein GW864_03200 [bacterium]|nr:hypothetical protein [bacterium]